MAETTTQKHLPEDTSNGEETGLTHTGQAGLPIARRELAQCDPVTFERADKIIISGLEVFANHGVLPAENELGQKFVVTATLYANLRDAGETDDLAATIDYGAVCRTIDDYLRTHTFKLIEAAAEGTAARLLNDYPTIIAVRLKIEKPWAPIGLPLSSVAVEIERTR